MQYLHPSAAAKQITGAFESLVLIDLKHSFKEYSKNLCKHDMKTL